MGDPLGEPRVEAGTALLDPGEVEAGRVGDRLQVVGRGEVGVATRDRRVLAGGEAGDGVWEHVAEVGVLRVAAVTRPEAVLMVSCIRLVSRPICCAPVALLLGRVRNLSRLTVCAPGACRKAL